MYREKKVRKKRTISRMSIVRAKDESKGDVGDVGDVTIGLKVSGSGSAAISCSVVRWK